MPATTTPEELTLDGYFRRLIGSAWVIGFASLAGAAAGLVLAMSAPVDYVATATLLVSVPQLGLDQRVNVRVAEFRLLIENRALASLLLEEFGLDEAPYSLHPITFLEENVTVAQVSGTNVIDLTVRLDDPALAAQLANRMAALAIDLNSQIQEAEAALGEQFVLDLLNQSEQRMEEQRTASSRRPGDRGDTSSPAQGGLEALAGPMQEYLELYRSQVDPTREEVDAKVARSVYSTLLEINEQADLRVFMSAARLRMLDPALPPRDPELASRGGLAGAILGCLFGFLLSVVAILFYQYLSTVRSLARAESSAR